MKSIITVLLLLTISSVYSHTLNKRETCEEQMENITEECISPIVYTENDKDNCSKVYIPKCLNFYKQPFSVLTECKDNAYAKTVYSESTVHSYYFSVESACSVDGDNNPCPVNDLYFNGEPNENTVKNSCLSKTCSNALNFYLDYILETTTSDNDTFMKLKNELNSEDCVKQNKDDVKEENISNDDTTSGDIRLIAKISTTLLISILLIFAFI